MSPLRSNPVVGGGRNVRARPPSNRVSFYRRGDIPVPHPLCADFPVHGWKPQMSQMSAEIRYFPLRAGDRNVHKR
jgi:hypothetical protein